MTKQLHKVVFINSAAIPYGEIELIGNTHFVGSNGFGKTTTLRTLLFFYNPTSEKRELAIRENQETFANYYLEFSNSYLAYEICKGELPSGEKDFYHILLRNQNKRIYYTFVNAPFEQRFYVDAEGRARNYDQIQKVWNAELVEFSQEIFRNSDYRNIIYGNTNNKDFRQYAIFNQRKSQEGINNIPKTISNIFLGSQLKSEYIKQSIISAIVNPDENKNIDLGIIHNQLRDFKLDLDDLETFDKYSAEANLILQLYQEVGELEIRMKTNAELLGNAVRNAGRKQKELDDEIEGLQEHLSREKTRLEEQELEIIQKQKGLNEEIGVQKRNLEEVKYLKKQYQETFYQFITRRSDLDAFRRKGLPESVRHLQEAGVPAAEGLARYTPTQEQQWQDDLQMLEESLRAVTAKAQDIQATYEKRMREVDAQKQSFENQLESRKNELTAAMNEKIRLENEKANHEKEQIRKQYDKNAEFENEKLSQIQSSVTVLETELTVAGKTEFLKESLDDVHEKIASLQKSIDKQANEIKLKKGQVENNETLYKLEHQSLNEKTDRENQALVAKDDRLKAQISELDKQITDYEQSFRKYLNDHLPNWEETVGKVVKPHLLSLPVAALQPQLTGSTPTFFGLTLDLSAVESEDVYLQDLDGLQNQKTKKEAERDNLKKDFQRLLADKSVEEKRLNEKYVDKNRELKKQIELLVLQNQKDELALKECLLEQSDQRQQSQSRKAQVLATLQQQVNEAKERLHEQKEVIRELKLHYQAQLDEIENLKKVNVANLKTEYTEQDLAGLQRELDEYRETYNRKKQEITAERNMLLLEKGIDNEYIAEIESKLKNAKLELEFSKFIQSVLLEYRLHRENYLDKEAIFMAEKEKLERELTDLQQEQKNLITHYYKNVAEQVNQQITNKQVQQKRFADGLEEFEKYFKNDPVFILYRKFIDEPELEDTEASNVSEIMAVLRRDASTKTQKYDQYKTTITRYTGRFLIHDKSFHQFTNKFESIHDFRLFVEEKLQPFIEENKIELARQQLEVKHQELITEVARRIKDIFSDYEKMDKKVREINADLENSNFVGVVKEIRMKCEPYTSNLLTAFKHVREFENENALHKHIQLFHRSKEGDKIELNQKSTRLLKELLQEIEICKKDGKSTVSIEDTFELQFRIKENKNDTGWINNLKAIGSTGTDILVKSMIYITLLNVFKEHTFRNEDYAIHCILDEAGQISDHYWKEVLDFANPKGIKIVLASPNENDPLIYDRVYKVNRDTSTDTVHIVELVGQDEEVEV